MKPEEYFQVLVHAAFADGFVQQPEWELLEGFGRRLKLSPDQTRSLIAEVRSGAEINVELDSDANVRRLMKHVMQILSADSELSCEEEEFFLAVGEQLGVAEVELLDIVSQVKEKLEARTTVLRDAESDESSESSDEVYENGFYFQVQATGHGDFDVVRDGVLSSGAERLSRDFHIFAEDRVLTLGEKPRPFSCVGMLIVLLPIELIPVYLWPPLPIPTKLKLKHIYWMLVSAGLVLLSGARLYSLFELLFLTPPPKFVKFDLAKLKILLSRYSREQIDLSILQAVHGESIEYRASPRSEPQCYSYKLIFKLRGEPDLIVRPFEERCRECQDEEFLRLLNCVANWLGTPKPELKKYSRVRS